MTEIATELETPAVTDETTPESERLNFRREWEKARKDAEAAKAELEAERKANADTKRELLFRKIGVDPESGPAKLLAKAYDGELSEEALRTAAIEYGVLTQQVPSEEQAAYTQAAQVGAGGEAGNPVETALDEVNKIPEIGPEGKFDAIAARAQLEELAAKHGIEITKTRPKSVNWLHTNTPVGGAVKPGALTS